MRHRKVGSIKPLQPTTNMLQSKKGAIPYLGGAMMIVGVGALAWGAWNHYFGDDTGDGSNGQELQVVEQTKTNPDGTTEVVKKPVSETAMERCGDGMTTSFDAVVVNPLDDDGSPTYLNTSLKLQREDGGGALRTYDTVDDGGFASSSLQLSCPQEYVINVPAQENHTESAHIASYSAETAVDDVQLEVDEVDWIKAQAYDELEHGAVYENTSGGTDYVDMKDGALTFKSTTDANTAYNMGTDGELDWTFRLKTDTQKAWGDLTNYVAVDADATDYEEPELMLDGQELEEVGKSGLPHEDDQGFLSDYEYVYKLPEDIGSSAQDLNFQVNAKDSIDPDQDITMRFVAESIGIDGTEARHSVFTQGGNEVLFSSPNKMTIDIA